MLLFKKIDVIIQIALLIFVTGGLVLVEEIAFPGILILGCVQLISTAVHLTFPPFYREQKLRIAYYILLLCAAIFFYLLIILELGEIMGFILYTIGTLLMAVYYIIICLREIKRITKKTVIQNSLS